MKKIIGFVSVSGIGFLLDLAVFVSLTELGAPVFWSNLIAGICGMTLVYTVSWSRIFTPADETFALKLLIYIGYGLCLLTVSSWMLAGLTDNLLRLSETLPFVVPPILIRLAAKAAITVFTLICNYAFSNFLVERLSFSRDGRRL